MYTPGKWMIEPTLPLIRKDLQDDFIGFRDGILTHVDRMTNSDKGWLKGWQDDSPMFEILCSS